ncbi:hypothetical protein ABU614_02600 [Lysobacter firmicutimachus]|uniref:Preprotein translocase subunit SecD n=1 Tax=Lysobacter firmicutimachus TaxID=1792846 RepID=A0AAU8MT20_9GAMM|nr:hypothetical protein [Lysobacter antibioticus]
MRPHDILPDGADTTVLGGATVRKGSVAAFLANARTLADPQADAAARAQAQRHIREVLPALRAIGLFETMQIRDPRLRAWVEAQA